MGDLTQANLSKLIASALFCESESAGEGLLEEAATVGGVGCVGATAAAAADACVCLGESFLKSSSFFCCGTSTSLLCTLGVEGFFLAAAAAGVIVAAFFVAVVDTVRAPSSSSSSLSNVIDEAAEEAAAFVGVLGFDDGASRFSCKIFFAGVLSGDVVAAAGSFLDRELVKRFEEDGSLTSGK